MPLKDKEARKAYHREYMRRKNKDPEYRKKHLARVRRNDKRYRTERKLLVASFKKKGCLVCPEKDPVCIHAHHTLAQTKKFNIADGVKRKVGLGKLKEELAKCVPLCANCHLKLHAGRINL